MTPVDVIIRSLRNHPDQWEASTYTLKSKEARIVLWIGNGILFLAPYEDSQPVRMNFIEQIRLWRAIKKWNAAKLFMTLKL